MAANKLTKEQIHEIITLYQNGSRIPDLASKYGVSYVNIRMLLKRRNLLKVNPKHKRTKNPDLDLTLFENIDTEFKAYLLGLIVADGYVGQNVEISLQEKDKQLLEEISKRLKLNSKLGVRKPRGNRQPNYRLFICSKDIVNQLNNLGLSNNKTKDLSPEVLENVPSNLLRHFVRGFFDGDGHITETQNDYCLGFTGCVSFIVPLKELLEETLGIHFSISNHSQTEYIKTIRVSGRYQCIQFSNWMYKNADIFMQRKYNKYLKLLESKKENPYGKLALRDYDLICSLYNTGKHTQKELANLYTISIRHIGRILAGYRPIVRSEDYM